ncbi:MAG: glycosyltransferase family A protein [Nostoc sp.]
MQLASTALPSIQSQTDRNFEWIVINDGADPDTKDIINSIKAKADFPISYIEMEHHYRAVALACATLVTWD